MIGSFESIFEYILASYESLSTVIVKTTAPYMSHSMQHDIYSSPSVLYDLCKYSRRQFDQLTLVFSTALSLYRTLHLIITSLILLISNPYFDTISLLMYIHLMMYILHQGSVLSYKNGFNPLNGDSPEWMDIPLNGFPLYDYGTIVKWYTVHHIFNHG